jgi:uncharacterized protein
MRYDPIEPPDPAAWRDLDAQERLILIEAFHRRAGDEAQSPQLHAVVHATVEDQVAAGEDIVCDTLARLQGEGLDRHEAIHAIGSIMTKHLYAALKSKAEPGNLHDAYLAEVETLTADRWRAEAAETLDDQDRNDPLGDGTDPGPLSAAELAQLSAFLARIKSDDALTLEGLDGFFCALIAGPDLVLPSEYLPVVWGGSTPGDGVFADAEEANTILQLMMRHWNAIIAELETHSVYEMLLGEPGERGLIGRAWARGFMRGVAMRHASWRELFTNQNEGQLLTIPLVAGEIDPDFPPEPLPTEKVEQLILWMGAGLGRAYRHFANRRQAASPDAASARTVRRDGQKVGRNDPCPCGSGRKFKRCCGAHDAPTRH